jgi:hypothetical protein
MAGFRLGRKGAGLFRLHRGSGRHAGGRNAGADAHAPAHAGYARAPGASIAVTSPYVPVPVVAPPVPAAPSPPAGPALDPRVGLVLRDGRELRLEAADPRARIFLTVASELLRPSAGQSITRSG